MKIIESEQSVKFNKLPTSEKIDVMLDYWNGLGEDPGSSLGFIKYAQSRDIDMSDVPNEEINRVWDLAAEYEGVEDEEEPIVVDGKEIFDSSGAKRWLTDKINKYGNTYHFPPSDRTNLDKLIDRFGSTYFWR